MPVLRETRRRGNPVSSPQQHLSKVVNVPAVPPEAVLHVLVRVGKLELELLSVGDDFEEQTGGPDGLAGVVAGSEVRLLGRWDRVEDVVGRADDKDPEALDEPEAVRWRREEYAMSTKEQLRWSNFRGNTHKANRAGMYLTLSNRSSFP